MAMCHPATVIWPDPSVIVPPSGATPEQIALLELQVELSLGYAWSTLQLLTAYQIAVCPITVRPCAQRCATGSYLVAPVSGPAGAPFWPYLVDGQMVNVLCGHDDGQCACSTVEEVRLPGPVGAVESVMIDGVDLASTAYRIDNGNRLVRQDGGAWPLCQDFNLPLGEPGTFSVTYYHGSTADTLVQFAAGILADEYLKGIQGSKKCRLPEGTTQLIRQGVTMELEKDMFEHGLTGIREVDAVTARFNPYREKMPSQVFSFDQPGARQTTWGL